MDERSPDPDAIPFSHSHGGVPMYRKALGLCTTLVVMMIVNGLIRPLF
jgi:hypothetical protein